MLGMSIQSLMFLCKNTRRLRMQRMNLCGKVVFHMVIRGDQLQAVMRVTFTAKTEHMQEVMQEMNLYGKVVSQGRENYLQAVMPGILERNLIRA